MTIVLERGKHRRLEEGMCLLEAVAFIAGEDFSDEPKCVSPVLAEFGRTLNDFLPDGARQRLVRLIPKLVGTIDPEQDQRDGLRCAHWLAAHWLPAWLDLVPELESHATALRAIPAPELWSDLEKWVDTVDSAASATSIARGSDGVSLTKSYSTLVFDTRRPAVHAVKSALGYLGYDGEFTTDTTTDAVFISRDACEAAQTLGRPLLPTIIRLEQDSINLFTELVEGRHK
jgi:hypothetical protein